MLNYIFLNLPLHIGIEYLCKSMSIIFFFKDSFEISLIASSQYLQNDLAGSYIIEHTPYSNISPRSLTLDGAARREVQVLVLDFW